MSRMIDRVLAAKIIYSPPWITKECQTPQLAKFVKDTYKAMQKTQVIVIDNVADYTFSHPKEIWDIERDYPNLAPPFGSFWMEYRAPGIALSRDGTMEHYYHPDYRRLGMFFEYIERDDGGPGWEILGILFSEDNAKEIIGPLLTLTMNVEPDGKAINGAAFRFFNNLEDKSEMQKRLESMSFFIPPFHLAVSFLHCKNVTIEPNYPPVALNKSYQKKHGRPMVKYYTLNIQPMKEVLRREGHSETTGLKHALHICRGHFKDYSDKGLFGKYKGMYWWDSHVRGTAEQGIIIKDYNVKEPKVTS